MRARRTSRVSIRDVAARAGVSVATVSNVLNHPDRVRASTRAGVEAAIQDLGFVPSAPARQLVVGRSSTIVYLVFDVSNPFFTDVARGVDEVARQAGLSLFLCTSDQDAAREDEYLAQLAELRVRGVLVTALDVRNPRLSRLRDQGVPVVLVDRNPAAPGEWCSVGVDDVAGGALAIAHLLELGHRRVAFVGGRDDIPQVADREAGGRSALVAAGRDPGSLVRVPTLALTVADGRAAAETLLARGPLARPTAIFCANDLVALGVLQHLIQCRVQVPDDISIVGYDDIDLAVGAVVPLTSVAQPRHELGRTAAMLLIEEADHPVRHSHRHVLFAPELVERASTSTVR